MSVGVFGAGNAIDGAFVVAVVAAAAAEEGGAVENGLERFKGNSTKIKIKIKIEKKEREYQVQELRVVEGGRRSRQLHTDRQRRRRQLPVVGDVLGLYGVGSRKNRWRNRRRTVVSRLGSC